MNISESVVRECVDEAYEAGFKGASDFYIEMFKRADMDDCSSMIVASILFRNSPPKERKDKLFVRSEK